MEHNLLPMWMLTELRMITEKEHNNRLLTAFPENTMKEGVKKFGINGIKNMQKEMEENPMHPLGKTKAILDEIQNQMDIYKNEALKSSMWAVG